MICPDCKIDMTEETVTKDFHDPQAFDGHGEREIEVHICEKCGYIDSET